MCRGLKIQILGNKQGTTSVLFRKVSADFRGRALHAPTELCRIVILSDSEESHTEESASAKTCM